MWAQIKIYSSAHASRRNVCIIATWSVAQRVTYFSKVSSQFSLVDHTLAICIARKGVGAEQHLNLQQRPCRLKGITSHCLCVCEKALFLMMCSLSVCASQFDFCGVVVRLLAQRVYHCFRSSCLALSYTTHNVDCLVAPRS